MVQVDPGIQHGDGESTAVNPGELRVGSEGIDIDQRTGIAGLGRDIATVGRFDGNIRGRRGDLCDQVTDDWVWMVQAIGENEWEWVGDAAGVKQLAFLKMFQLELC